MHLEVRIFFQRIHRDERTPVAERHSIFGATVGAFGPAPPKHLRNLL